MGRPKGSKNKPKAAAKTTQAKAKAKAKAKPPTKAEPPDWLRKAMAVKTPTKAKAGRKPNAIKEKFKAKAKARRGKTMANISKDKPLADPELDPDFGVPAPKPGPELGKPHPDNTLPKPGEDPFGKPKGTPIVTERVDEPAPLFDEVQSGADIPDENIQMLIAGTLGGTGDHHADAKRIVERMHQAEWTVAKALDAGTGDTRKGRKADASIKPDPYKTPDRDNNDPKGADAGKGRSKDDPKGADDGKRS